MSAGEYLERWQPNIYGLLLLLRGRSHITSAAGGGVSQRLTIADGGGRRGPGTPDFGWRNMWTAPYVYLKFFCCWKFCIKKYSCVCAEKGSGPFDIHCPILTLIICSKEVRTLETLSAPDWNLFHLSKWAVFVVCKSPEYETLVSVFMFFYLLYCQLCEGIVFVGYKGVALRPSVL